jgi:hypothetical protein
VAGSCEYGDEPLLSGTTMNECMGGLGWLIRWLVSSFIGWSVSYSVHSVNSVV